MIRGLAIVFAAFTAYGIWAGLYGGALLSALMWALTHYAHGWFRAVDQAHTTGHERAQPSTSNDRSRGNPAESGH